MEKDIASAVGRHGDSRVGGNDESKHAKDDSSTLAPIPISYGARFWGEYRDFS